MKRSVVLTEIRQFFTSAANEVWGNARRFASLRSTRNVMVAELKLSQKKRYRSSLLRSSFIGCGAVKCTMFTRKRRTTVCRLEESVDLSAPSPKYEPWSTLQSAFIDMSNPVPPPVTISRRSLDQDFAVLLMRSGYQCVDDLDFVAMDRFQQEFFEIRSLAWEKWIKVNASMRQGLLTDARYFDFISYAQMLTIHKFLRQPYSVFEERYNVVDGHWDTRVVQRDVLSLAHPRDILEAFRVRVGDKMYMRMMDTVGYPAPVDTADTDNLLHGIKDIYGYFQIGGFFVDVDIHCDSKSGTCVVDMVAPAILWGARALRKVRSIPNDYDVFAVKSFLRACNVHANVETDIRGSSIFRRWSLHTVVT